MTSPLGDAVRVFRALGDSPDLREALRLLGFDEARVLPASGRPAPDASEQQDGELAPSWKNEVDDAADEDLRGFTVDLGADILRTLVRDPRAADSAGGGGSRGPSPAGFGRRAQEKVAYSILEPTVEGVRPPMPAYASVADARAFVPVASSLLDRRTLPSTLASLTKTPRRGTMPDLYEAMRRLVLGQSVADVPVEQLPSAPLELVVLVDRGLQPGPHAADVDRIIVTLRGLLGTGNVRVWHFDHSDDLRCGPGPVWTWRPLREQLPRASLLFVVAESPSRTGGPAPGAMIRRQAHSSVIAFTSAGPTERPGQVWSVGDADGSAGEPPPAAFDDLLALLETDGFCPERTEVDLLAVHLAVPPVATWDHVRRVRRRLLGPHAVDTEGLMTSYPFVHAVTARGIVFNHEFRRSALAALRSIYAADEVDDLAVTWLRSPTAELPALLEHETDLVFSFVTSTEFQPVVIQVLTDVLRTYSYEQRSGIRNWARGAVLRLPEEILATPPGYLLRRIAGISTFGATAPTADTIDLELVRELVEVLPRRHLAFRRDGEQLTIGAPSRGRAFAVTVPAIAGTLLEVRWHDAESGEAMAARVDADRPVTRIPTGRAAVELFDVLGSSYLLEPFPVGRAPEIIALDESLNALRRAHVRQDQLEATLVNELPNGTIVRFTGLPMCTAFVPRGRGGASWTHGEVRTVQIYALYPSRRYVVASVVAGTGEQPTPGDVCFGRVTNVGDYGVFVDVGGVRGLLHNQEIPASAQLQKDDLIQVRVLPGGSTHRLSLALEPPRGPHEIPRHLAYRPGGERETANASFAESNTPGTELVGEVVAQVDAGILVALRDAVIALIHNSELAADHVPQVRDRIPVIFLGGFADGLRVTLRSPRRRGEVARQDEYRDDDETREMLAPRIARYPIGTIVSGTVAILLDNRLILRLDDGHFATLPLALLPTSNEPEVGQRLSQLEVTRNAGGRIRLGRPGEQLADLEEVVRATHRILAAQTEPINLALLGTLVRDSVGAGIEWRQFGYPRFRDFLIATCPGVSIRRRHRSTSDVVDLWRSPS